MGKKSDNATVTKRIEEVLRIRLDGAQFHDIVQYASENKWGVGERQLWNYVQKSDDLLAERSAETREKAVTRHLAQRKVLFARSVNAADYRTALSVLSDEAKLLGLYPAARLEVDVSGEVTYDFSRLTDEQLDRLDAAFAEITGLPPRPPLALVAREVPADDAG